ncbi:phosphoglycerate kinase, cytosolic [Tanacetum coccineum]|uniref:Phosphoglycerate kinase n=1 Tax=Tanacetum coccineum TaxID=301880 RepID=A0ABQ4WC32_9ASTR
MEDEFYGLTVNGSDLKTYIRRFQELAFICPNMVPNSEKLMEAFIGGQPQSIKGNVTASKPQTLEEATNMPKELMDQMIIGRPNGVTPKYSLKPLVPRLFKLLGVEVKMANDCVGPEVEKLVAGISDGGVLLLENVRFYKKEEKNDPEYAKKLASLADLYVNDAFGTAHTAHASTECIAKYLKRGSEKISSFLDIDAKLPRFGFYVPLELDYLVGAVSSPNKLFAAIVGGSKIPIARWFQQKKFLTAGWDWTLDQILSSHLVKLWILPKPLFRMDLWVYLRWKSLLLEPRYELILSHVTLPDNLDWCGRAPTPVKGPFLDANHNIYDLGRFNNTQDR